MFPHRILDQKGSRAAMTEKIDGRKHANRILGCLLIKLFGGKEGGGVGKNTFVAGKPKQSKLLNNGLKCQCVHRYRTEMNALK